MISRCVTLLPVLFSSILLFAGCSSFAKKAGLSGPPVAERINVGGDELVVADITAFRDTVILPLGALTKELEIIPLDNRQEALFSYGSVVVSENYLGVITSTPRSFKLFDRKGKYLRDIGKEGRGPGEYGNIYSARIDEKTGRIYILPWTSEQLLVFGMDGTAYPPVKLAYRSGKGVFDVNPDGTFTVAVVPIGGAGIWAWTQDAEGNVINEIPNPDPSRYADFSSEVYAYRNTAEFDPFLTIFSNKSNDTLQSYDYKAGRMIPRFSVKNIQDKEPPYYTYGQLPHYFIGNYAPGLNQVGERIFQGLPPVNFIVDKKTLQGAYYRLVMDELGGIDVWPSFTQGYFVWNAPAVNLKDKLEKALGSGSVTDAAMLEKIRKLNDSFDEEDNNIIFLGRLRE